MLLALLFNERTSANNKKVQSIRTRYTSIRLNLSEWCLLAFTMLKIAYLLISFALRNSFAPTGIAKIVISAACNFLLYFRISKLDHKKSARQTMNAASFKLPFIVSTLTEALYETECSDIIPVNFLFYSCIYEDLYEELFDRLQIFFFEALRIGLLLYFHDSAKKTALLLVKDLACLFTLYKLKEQLYAYLHKLLHQNDLQAATLQGNSRIIDSVSSAVFLLTFNADLAIEFKNDKAVKLCESLQHFSSLSNRVEEELTLNPEPGQQRLELRRSSSKAFKEDSFAGLLRLPESNKLFAALRGFASNRSEYAETLSGVVLLDPQISFDAVISPIEWMNEKRILVEVYESKYQNINMAHDLIDVCAAANNILMDKYFALNDFVRKSRVSHNVQQHRVSTALGLYCAQLMQQVSMTKDYMASLAFSVRDQKVGLSPMDLMKAEQLLRDLGERAVTFNYNRRNSFTLGISSYFAKGCFVRYDYLKDLMLSFFSYCLSTNIGNRFDVKISAKQSTESLCNLEFTFTGCLTDTFCSEVLNSILGDSTPTAREELINKYPHVAHLIFMVNHLKKQLSVRCKVVGSMNKRVSSAQNLSITHHYSRLSANQQQSEAECCTARFIFVLDETNIYSKEIDRRVGKTVFAEEAASRYVEVDQIKRLSELKVSSLVMNPRIADSIKDSPVAPLGWAASQSFEEDFNDLKVDKHIENIMTREAILADQSLGVIEEELFHWNLKVGCSLLASSLAIDSAEESHTLPTIEGGFRKCAVGASKLRDGIKPYLIPVDDAKEVSPVNSSKRIKTPVPAYPPSLLPKEIKSCQAQVRAAHAAPNHQPEPDRCLQKQAREVLGPHQSSQQHDPQRRRPLASEKRDRAGLGLQQAAPARGRGGLSAEPVDPGAERLLDQQERLDH